MVTNKYEKLPAWAESTVYIVNYTVAESGAKNYEKISDVCYGLALIQKISRVLLLEFHFI